MSHPPGGRCRGFETASSKDRVCLVAAGWFFPGRNRTHKNTLIITFRFAIDQPVSRQ